MAKDPQTHPSRCGQDKDEALIDLGEFYGVVQCLGGKGLNDGGFIGRMRACKASIL